MRRFISVHTISALFFTFTIFSCAKKEPGVIKIRMALSGSTAI